MSMALRRLNNEENKQMFTDIGAAVRAWRAL